ncbi:MAG: D-lyxose/D-mannose family sugar isomerase [Planctomycetota bacterium]|nr:MAG: D-lyxose/D-mannose family sugar isomerase [Planctomycetota bacterium]
MKRSEINSLLKDTLNFFKEQKFALPKWATWSPENWKESPELSAKMKSLQLGWDVTDFGTKDFYKTGLILFCLRNGNLKNKSSKPYAEKIMVVREDQETPLHFHTFKEEDIINRGGGKLVLELYHKNSDGQLDTESNVIASIDEIETTVKPGEKIILETGQSITLSQNIFHRFYGLKGEGKVLTGEVSRVNDDLIDNTFLKAPGRFAQIEEDESPLYPLWSEL